MMRVFTNGTDTVVAADLADAQRVVEAHYGATFEQEGWSLDEWREVAGDKTISICTNPDEDSDPVSKTASEWASSDGRGFLCSTEF